MMLPSEDKDRTMQMRERGGDEARGGQVGAGVRKHDGYYI